jgi:uncharacterized membrane protein YbhN (UPF0104 family)
MPNVLRQLLKMLKKYKVALVIVILLVTVAVFVHFFATHTNYLTILKHVKPSAILAIIGLNALLTIVLAIIFELSLIACGVKLPFKEQLLVTAYSSIANFFGPLQSGPGVRAVYLKAKHQVRLRDYTLVTLVGYALFAMLSALLVLVGSRPWWQTVGALIVVAVGCTVVIGLFVKRGRSKAGKPGVRFTVPIILGLLLATLAQVAIVAAYYSVELRAVGVRASLHQVLVYTGAANFALFVSLTPDAIGFRESFLALSRRLHHIANASMLAANVLDRAVYAAYLGLLFLIVVAVHGRDQLKTWQARSRGPTASS